MMSLTTHGNRVDGKFTEVAVAAIEEAVAATESIGKFTEEAVAARKRRSSRLPHPLDHVKLRRDPSVPHNYQQALKNLAACMRGFFGKPLTVLGGL